MGAPAKDGTPPGFESDTPEGFEPDLAPAVTEKPTPKPTPPKPQSDGGGALDPVTGEYNPMMHSAETNAEYRTGLPDAAVGAGSGATFDWDDEIYGRVHQLANKFGLTNKTYEQARQEWADRKKL